ncbi:G-type lectin S-receptor-like serine/threonine-protein kinase At1g11300 isoform X2 [Silene latifolia]|uniref:G-type lectin S-receptor-like serine/threonine-protein kinase At1g11300 isoform X2 n=1 Tax=Silene latifolia TaxID=37657 RepID=UPI003D770AC2
MLPLYIFLAYSCLAFHLAAGIGNATAIQLLKDSETIFSPNATYKLGFFSPPNNTDRYLGISFNQVSPTYFVWVANRDNPLKDSTGVLRLSEGRSLEIVDKKNDTFWSFKFSSPATNASLKIQLLDSGNLCVVALDKGGNSTVIWQSFDYPTDSLLPNMKITVKNTTATRLHAWTGPSDPSEGRFTVGLDSSINPQLVIWDGNKRHYRTGPWNGNLFLGMTYTDPTNDYADIYIQNNVAEDEVTLLYTGANQLSFSHYYFSYDGSLNEIWWDSGKRSWRSLYKAPDSQCDYYGKCGSYGTCNLEKAPICECLRGFVPNNTQEWKAGNWSSGCVRKTPLQCGKQGSVQDGFLLLKYVKLPDLELWLQGVSPNDCRTLCLNNCSCLAYAYDPGAGCMYWSQTLIDIQQFTIGGIDLNLRLAHSELGKKSRVKAVIVATLTVGTGLIIALIILWIFLSRSRGRGKEKQANRNNILDQLNHRDHKSQRKLEDLPLIDFIDLAEATDNFHNNQMLGQGGFGQVYKGKLRDGREIAVKRLSAASLQGVEEFMNEVVVISRLQHKNLVSLIGFCDEGQEKMLVYEYMPNKSLDAFLFDSTKRELLDWRKRFNIIEGICRGLIYLHRDSRLRIIHRDLKASNILLDEQLNSKIADFGMARIFGHGQVQDETRRVVGTYGYMAPEYAMDGYFSEKSDVYSFGVLLLELLTAKKNKAFWYEDESLTLLGYVWKLWAEGNAGSIIDPVIYVPHNKEEINRSLQVGLLCVQENVNDRPNMSTVMSMFSSDITDLPWPKEPGFNKRHVVTETITTQLHQISGENISITAISGR